MAGIAGAGAGYLASRGRRKEEKDE